MYYAEYPCTDSILTKYYTRKGIHVYHITKPLLDSNIGTWMKQKIYTRPNGISWAQPSNS